MESGLTKDERTWAMLCHFAAYSMFITGIGYILGPLIVWLIKKDESEFINRHGKEALNFQISMTIYMFCCIPLIIVLIGIPLLIILGIANIVLILIAGIRANDGLEYQYPFTIRFIK